MMSVRLYKYTIKQKINQFRKTLVKFLGHPQFRPQTEQ